MRPRRPPTLSLTPERLTVNRTGPIRTVFLPKIPTAPILVDIPPESYARRRSPSFVKGSFRPEPVAELKKDGDDVPESSHERPGGKRCRDDRRRDVAALVERLVGRYIGAAGSAAYNEHDPDQAKPMRREDGADEDVFHGHKGTDHAPLPSGGLAVHDGRATNHCGGRGAA